MVNDGKAIGLLKMGLQGMQPHLQFVLDYLSCRVNCLGKIWLWAIKKFRNVS